MDYLKAKHGKYLLVGLLAWEDQRPALVQMKTKHYAPFGRCPWELSGNYAVAQRIRPVVPL